MVKAPATGTPRLAALGAFLLIAFLSGCSSTSQPERPVQELATAKPQAVAKAAPQAPTETPYLAEQNAMAEVDENSSIFFSLGSSTVKPSEMDKLTRTAQRLKDDRELDVTLIGHTDNYGSRSLNLAVADARVGSVSAILKRLGVRTQQIKKKVSGGEKTSEACRSEACRQKMRRVELVISTPD